MTFTGLEITTSKFPDIQFFRDHGNFFFFFFLVCIPWTVTVYQATTLTRDENRVTNCELLVKTHTFISIFSTATIPVVYTQNKLQ